LTFRSLINFNWS